MLKPTPALVFHRLRDSALRFRDDESGAMAFFFLLMFVLMITFGGIAIDVMRFETRRVAMQQTLDRAALAAASLTQSRTPQQVVDDYFAKADLGKGLVMVDFAAPTVTALTDAGLRRVTASAQVTSTNFFMGIFSPLDTLEAPSMTEAAQGVSQIEVMMVLDITGSMGDPAGGGKTKIQALRDAAAEFVKIVKANDKKDGVSIGVVPYAAQVNIPANLRAQFNAQNVPMWNGVAGAGVPNINCFEFPTSSYSQTAYLPTTPIQMAAVADSQSSTTTTTDYVAPLAPVATSRACTTNAETTNTAWVDADVNKVLMPTKNGQTVIDKVSRLTAAGNTYSVVGMRWGTALLDEEARPIYTNLLSSEPGMAGRPADNNSIQTRKIIILMTDGDHVTNTYVYDGFKTGLSPIYRGASDGRFAIRFTTGGPALTGGTRPVCAGANTYFVPHLKPNSDTTCNSLTSAGRVAWLSTPSWTGSGTVKQLDWSEVWQYLRVSWVARQLYMRSNVSGTGTYSTVMDTFRGTYLSNTSNMDTLLQTNCSIARKDPKLPVAQAPVGKGGGIEVYGIAFGETISANGQAQINKCSSSPKENYYFLASDGDKLMAAFKAIATDISELRLTQ